MKSSLAQSQVGFLNSLLVLLNELLSLVENGLVQIQHLPFARTLVSCGIRSDDRIGGSGGSAVRWFIPRIFSM
jgi:hypothetical protein